MAYMIGFLGAPFLLAFLAVHFIGRNRYMKSHGEKMSAGRETAWVIGIGIVFAGIALMGM